MSFTMRFGRFMGANKLKRIFKHLRTRPQREYLILAIDRLTFWLWNAIPHVDFELLTSKCNRSKFRPLDAGCQVGKSILMFSVIAEVCFSLTLFIVAFSSSNLRSDLPIQSHLKPHSSSSHRRCCPFTYISHKHSHKICDRDLKLSISKKKMLILFTICGCFADSRDLPLIRLVQFITKHMSQVIWFNHSSAHELIRFRR